MLCKTNFGLRIIAFFVAIINFFAGVFGMPKLSNGERIDMSKFEEQPVFVDEFEGDSLDLSKWTAMNYTRRGGYWDKDLIEVHDGNLYIKTKYIEQGINGKPAGWYTACIETKNKYEQKYGYMECRCIFPKGYGHWSAFWMMNDSVNNVNGDGKDGSEIDIMESAFWANKKLKNSTGHAIHYDGYFEDHKQTGTGNWRISGDPYNEYHTYGVEWNEKEYRFYIDGKLTGVTDFGGVSRSPEFLILSVEIGGDDGVPDNSWVGKSIEANPEGKDFSSEFIVDYVKCYQYKNN